MIIKVLPNDGRETVYQGKVNDTAFAYKEGILTCTLDTGNEIILVKLNFVDIMRLVKKLGRYSETQTRENP